MSYSTTQDATLEATLDTTQDGDSIGVSTDQQFALLPVHGGLKSIVVGEGEDAVSKGGDGTLSLKVGRNPKDHHCVDDKRISKTHVILYLRGDKLSIKDMSTNGTVVNGKPLPKKEEVTLQHGDVVTLLKVTSTTAPTSLEWTVFVPARVRSPHGPGSGSDGDERPAKKQRTHDSATTGTSGGAGPSGGIDSTGKGNQNQNTAQVKAAARIDETMTCGICTDLFYKPITVLPCLHNYCSACWSGWRKKSTSCPACRIQVTSIKKNHDIRNIVEAHLAAYPDKQRSTEELAEMDAADEVKDDEMRVHPVVQAHGHAGGGYDSDGSYSSYFSGESQEHCPSCDTPEARDGFQCPDYNGALAQQIRANLASDNDEDVLHYFCTAGNHYFPARRYDPNVDPSTPAPAPTAATGLPSQGRGAVQCGFCRDRYCRGYTGACPSGHDNYTTANGTSLCRLQKLRDHDLTSTPLPLFIGRNVHETQALQAYLQAQGQNVHDAFHQTIAKVLDGSYVSEHGPLPAPLPPAPHIDTPVTLDTPMCIKCVRMRYLPVILLAYRMTIPKSDLPVPYRDRPDCWYGVECRTQNHKPAHASKLNHACRKSR